MSSKRLNDNQLKKMRQDYMDYIPVSVIAEKYDVARSTVIHRINKGWETERGLLRAELYANLSQAKQVDFNAITSNTIKILKRSLENLANRSEAPTLREAVDSSKILDVLDKITRLDEGTPTDIISNNDKPIEIIDLKKKLHVDPFYVEFKDVKEDKETKDKNENN